VAENGLSIEAKPTRDVWKSIWLRISATDEILAVTTHGPSRRRRRQLAPA
jgi:hypothetical protein